MALKGKYKIFLFKGDHRIFKWRYIDKTYDLYVIEIRTKKNLELWLKKYKHSYHKWEIDMMLKSLQNGNYVYFGDDLEYRDKLNNRNDVKRRFVQWDKSL